MCVGFGLISVVVQYSPVAIFSPVIPRPHRFPDVGEQSLASQFENSDERVAELNNRVQAISVREGINHAILGD